MSPKAYAQLYTAMTWTYDKTKFNCNVNRYTINKSDSDRIKIVRQGKDALLAALRAGARAKTVTIAGGTYSAVSPGGAPMTLTEGSIARTYTGKGAPDDIQRGEPGLVRIAMRVY